MKAFKDQAAQGDVLFRRIDKLPGGVEQVEAKGPLIVAHSETGHHHSFAADAGVWLYSTKEQLVSYLKVDKPAVLDHHRPHDTHEALVFDVGVYEVRRQREYTPEGWRRVED